MEWFTTERIVIIGAALGLLAAINLIDWGGLFGRLKGIKLPSVGGGSVNDDAADLEAFNRLVKRYERLGCKEGIEVMRVAGTHFLHTEGHQ